MVTVSTTVGELNESALMKREDSIENDNEVTSTVEYCLKDCTGDAHRTGQPDSESHFCCLHVHRSAHVTLKRVPSITGEAGAFA